MSSNKSALQPGDITALCVTWAYALVATGSASSLIKRQLVQLNCPVLLPAPDRWRPETIITRPGSESF